MASSRTPSALHRLLRLQGVVSYAEARLAYQRKALEIHPDLVQGSDKAAAHQKFAELQSAWEAFKRDSKNRVTSPESNIYTGVGVGCSWTDDDDEREFRRLVMEMASRGVMFPRELGGNAETTQADGGFEECQSACPYGDRNGHTAPDERLGDAHSRRAATSVSARSSHSGEGAAEVVDAEARRGGLATYGPRRRAS